jgi:DNA-directed RNA polymerase specialized sigma24 family protein
MPATAAEIAEYLPLARREARAFWDIYGDLFEFDDLCSIASLAIVEAAQTWERGVTLGAYARTAIRRHLSAAVGDRLEQRRHEVMLDPHHILKLRPDLDPRPGPDGTLPCGGETWPRLDLMAALTKVADGLSAPVGEAIINGLSESATSKEMACRAGSGVSARNIRDHIRRMRRRSGSVTSVTDNLSTREVARVLKISSRMVRKLAESGAIIASKGPRGRWQIPTWAVEDARLSRVSAP